MACSPFSGDGEAVLFFCCFFAIVMCTSGIGKIGLHLLTFVSGKSKSKKA
jgi:hypothetical protein